MRNLVLVEVGAAPLPGEIARKPLEALLDEVAVHQQRVERIQSQPRTRGIPTR